MPTFRPNTIAEDYREQGRLWKSRNQTHAGYRTYRRHPPDSREVQNMETQGGDFRDPRDTAEATKTQETPEVERKD